MTAGPSRPKPCPEQPAESRREKLPGFPHAAHAEILERSRRGFDPDRFRTVFPDQWASFLRRHFRSTLDVQMFFSVSERTARGWWQGTGGRATGDAVALAALTYPQGFAAAIAPQDRAA